MEKMETKKISKKEIVKTLRTYDVTKICRLHKKVFGEVPVEIRDFGGKKVKCLDGFKLYRWAADYATSRKMDHLLYSALSQASHHWKHSVFDLDAVYCNNGYYEPTLKQRIVSETLKFCADPHSRYAKMPMMGFTHLYFCSPVYGHSDYNKWCAIEIKGNERFCELVVAIARRNGI